MAKRINDTSKIKKQIVDTSKTKKHIDPNEIAEALGASPISFHAIKTLRVDLSFGVKDSSNGQYPGMTTPDFD